MCAFRPSDYGRVDVRPVVAIAYQAVEVFVAELPERQ
jgi:hypothetical protein